MSAICRHGHGEVGEDTSLLAPPTYWESRPAGRGKRHLVVFMMFFGTFTCYALRVNVSITLVAMVNSTRPHSNPSTLSNSNAWTYIYVNTSHEKTNVHGDEECQRRSPPSNHFHTGEFNWSPNTQGLILGAFFYGYMTTQMAGGWLAQKMGGKFIFGGGVLCTAILTLLIPVVARTSVRLLIALRVLQGIGEGVTYPALYVMISKWAPFMERSMIGTIALSGGNLGTVIAQPVSGILCDYGFAGGWPSVFYVFGGFGCLWFIVWMLIVHESPEIHPKISEAERSYIVNSRCTIQDGKILVTPWRDILTSGPVLAKVIISFCNCWNLYMLMTILPTYFKQVLKYEASENGLAMGMPFLCLWIIEISSGFLADTLRTREILSTAQTRKLFAFSGAVFPALALVHVGYLGCTRLATVLVFCVAIATMGFSSAGQPVNVFDIAPNFAGPIKGLVNTLASLSGLLAPQVATWIVQGQPYASSWRPVFFLSAGLLVFGAIFFVIFATGEQQPWDLQALRSQEDPDRDTKVIVSDPVKSNIETYNTFNQTTGDTLDQSTQTSLGFASMIYS